MNRRIRYHLKRVKIIQILIFFSGLFCVITPHVAIILTSGKPIPPPQLTRLFQNKPITLNLQPFSVCHPDKLGLHELLSYYHQYSNKRTCFLIEDLDGGPWWSYVSQEFAEILTYLKELGQNGNVSYENLSNETNFNINTNLTKYFLMKCNFNEDLYMANKIPIVILIWNVNRPPWNAMLHEWKYILESLHIRVLAFIDDLHFETLSILKSRQYLFEHVATEIFSPYTYLFHNYYTNISTSKLTWLPHAASSMSSYHSVNKSASNRLLVSGANMFDWYPCRSRAFRLCKRRKDLVACLRHPGYGPDRRNGSSYFYSGKPYFTYMRRYVFGLGTCQSVHYAVGKMFELPANGVALVTTIDMIPILERLYLSRNEHYLAINCSSESHLIDEIINLQYMPKNEIDKIRSQGQKIIHERHMTKHRAQLLHVRLLVHALILTSISDDKRKKLDQWGRCIT